ncbi:hypothetical protein [Rhizobium ruizarguesonis]|uniref:hypothetical protein n=1 Tax=Rhizobium ruizarguesonis TaxID=2081791 RepID=UPI0010325311|nr:hypothetical protein [Rhizobium ruizarguesonis]NEI32160.1 hypothetical protein [Rhizobium ruizarguesonis]TBB79471.1 hypothetical protein ELH38_37890 [Rhizobium ruizarguesonis]
MSILVGNRLAVTSLCCLLIVTVPNTAHAYVYYYFCEAQRYSDSTAYVVDGSDHDKYSKKGSISELRKKFLSTLRAAAFYPDALGCKTFDDFDDFGAYKARRTGEVEEQFEINGFQFWDP